MIRGSGAQRSGSRGSLDGDPLAGDDLVGGLAGVDPRDELGGGAGGLALGHLVEARNPAVLPGARVGEGAPDAVVAGGVPAAVVGAVVGEEADRAGGVFDLLLEQSLGGLFGCEFEDALVGEEQALEVRQDTGGGGTADDVDRAGGGGAGDLAPFAVLAGEDRLDLCFGEVGV